MPKCYFCANEAQVQLIDEIIIIRCEVCGTYYVDEDLAPYLTNKLSGLSQVQNSNLIAFNIERTENYEKVLWVDHSDDLEKPHIKRIRNKDEKVCIGLIDNESLRPIIHSDKPINLLLRLSEKVTGSPFSQIAIDERDFRRLRIVDAAECLEWLRYMELNRLLENSGISSFSAQHGYENAFHLDGIVISSEGWRLIEKHRSPQSSKKVFVAMKFNWDGEVELLKTIKRACSHLGYEADVVSAVHHNDSINDHIIAGIRSAKFIVADFTMGSQGVYYEAGYAAGLDIPVIKTVRSTDIKNLHFDTSHLNHIEWSDYKFLEEALIARIRATIR